MRPKRAAKARPKDHVSYVKELMFCTFYIVNNRGVEGVLDFHLGTYSAG